MEQQYSFGTGQSPIQENKKSGGSKKGCFIIAIIIVFIVFAAAGYFIYKAITSIKTVTEIMKPGDLKPKPTDQKSKDDRFNGSFLDALMVPQKDGKTRLWILTDGSTKYIKKIKSTGYSSTEVACTDCKSLAYVYDPERGDVINHTENKYKDVISDPYIAYTNGKIIQFTRSRGDDEANIITYDAFTGEVVLDTKDFVSNHPELSSGISQLYKHPEDNTVRFDMKDGQKNLIYSIGKDKFYKSDKELTEDNAKDAGDGTGSIFFLKSDSYDARKKIWKITASKKNLILKGGTYLSYAGQSYFSNYKNEADAQVLSDKIYLEGIIYYQDDNYVVIIYLDQVGKTANRIMTCIDSNNGNEKWTIKPEDMFDIMKIDANSRFS